MSSNVEKRNLHRLWFRNSVRDTLCLLSGLVLLLFWKVLPIHIRHRVIALRDAFGCNRPERVSGMTARTD